MTDGNVVIPTLPYLDAKKRQYVQHMKFTDYSTGKNYPNDDSLDDFSLLEVLEFGARGLLFSQGSKVRRRHCWFVAQITHEN